MKIMTLDQKKKKKASYIYIYIAFQPNFFYCYAQKLFHIYNIQIRYEQSIFENLIKFFMKFYVGLLVFCTEINSLSTKFYKKNWT